MSDIHRGAFISALPEYEERLKQQMAGYEHVVLNGDIFELFYIDRKFYGFDKTANDYAVVKKAIKESIRFLNDFLEKNPHTKLHFILGNHEVIYKFRHQLNKLQAEHDNFEWHPEAIKIGSALFVHGDLAMDGTKDDRKRKQFSIDKRRRSYHLGDAEDHTKWTKILAAVDGVGQAAVNRWRAPEKAIPILESWLEQNHEAAEEEKKEKKHKKKYQGPMMSEDGKHKPFSMDDIEHVFFGHTHVKFHNLPSTIFPDVMIHNTGALTTTVMRSSSRYKGHGMLEVDIRRGKVEKIRPFGLENNYGKLAPF